MLAVLSLASVLDAFCDSFGTILKTGRGATQTITNRLASVARGGSDCVANPSTGSSDYATCAQSES